MINIKTTMINMKANVKTMLTNMKTKVTSRDHETFLAVAEVIQNHVVPAEARGRSWFLQFLEQTQSNIEKLLTP